MYNKRSGKRLFGAFKLTVEDVLEIRELCKKGIKQTLIAEQFNTTPETVSRIKNNKVWQEEDFEKNRNHYSIKHFYPTKSCHIKKDN